MPSFIKFSGCFNLTHPNDVDMVSIKGLWPDRFMLFVCDYFGPPPPPPTTRVSGSATETA